MVAILEVGLGHRRQTADALGHVVAGHFDVDAAGIGAHLAMHLEKTFDLLEHPVERPRFIAV